MEIINFLKKPLIFNANDNIAHVISKMFEEKRYEALVFDNDFEGVISARDLLKSPLNNPQKMRIGDFVRKISPISAENSAQEIIKYLLANDYKEIPIKYNNEIMTISKISLLKLLNKEVIREKNIKDVMIYPYSVKADYDLAEVKSIMKNLNFTQLPVIDNENRIEGTIDILDILNAILNKERMTFGERVGEKIAQEKIPISFFMKRNVIKLSEDEKISKIIEVMTDKKEHTVFVEKNGKLTGMVTVKNILKLIEMPFEDVYIHISGFNCIEDDFSKSAIKNEIENFVKKMKKIITINYFAIHMEKHTKGGKKIKYTVKGRISTHHHIFFAEDHEWDAIKATKLFLNKLEREIIKKIEKYRKH